MRIKTKITLGLVFLFSVIVIISVLSIHYLNLLNVRNQLSIEEAYRSQDNVHGLQTALDEIRNSFTPVEESNVSLEKLNYRLNPALDRFENHLKKQQLSLTEEGKAALVNDIAVQFQALKNFIAVTRTKDYYFDKLIPLMQDLNEKINQVYMLNKMKIESRSQKARATAQRVIYTVAAILAFCVIIAFTFMVGFPRIVAEPVEKLTAAIDRIKRGDYSTPVELDSRDEFGALGDAFNEMSKRIEAYEKVNLQKLVTEQQRLDTMIQKISEGIIGLDAQFNVLFINPFAANLLGLSHKEAVARSAKDLSFKNESLQKVISDLLDYAENGKRYVRNKLIKSTYKNKPAYLVRKVVPTYNESDGNREPNGYIIMLKNITEYKEQADARTNFIATVSHELKTPIASIRMSLKLLKDERMSKLNEQQEELVEDLEWEVNRLLNITQELLNTSEAESGRINLHPEWVRLEDVVGEALDSVDTLASDRQIEIVDDLPANLPRIHVDEDKLTWVLINFLTNAIKYTPVNSTIRLFAEREGDTLTIGVKDNGKGIPKDEQKKVFERYYRIPGSEGKGTGLGLSISKDIIEQMNGKIGVESAPGEGALFYVKLKEVWETSATEEATGS